MKHSLRNYILSVIGALLAIAVACERDKTHVCTPPDLSEHIVGTWNAKLESGEGGENQLEFVKGGIYKESKGLLFGKQSLSVRMTWKVTDTWLTITAEYDSTNKETYALKLTERTCEEIVLDLDGLDKLKLIKDK